MYCHNIEIFCFYWGHSRDSKYVYDAYIAHYRLISISVTVLYSRLFLRQT